MSVIEIRGLEKSSSVSPKSEECHQIAQSEFCHKRTKFLFLLPFAVARFALCTRIWHARPKGRGGH